MSQPGENRGEMDDELDDPATDALLNHEAMNDPLGYATQVVINAVDAEKQGSLRTETDGDYVLEEESCWIQVGNLSVQIKKDDEGVGINVYPLDNENSEALASTYACYGDADVSDE